MNFNLCANMAGFCSDSHIFTDPSCSQVLTHVSHSPTEIIHMMTQIDFCI